VASKEFEYYLAAKDPKLEVNVFCLEGDGWKDNDCVTDWDKEDWKEGVDLCARPRKRLNPKELEKAGFEMSKNEKGEEEFKVTSAVVFQYHPDKEMSIGWKIKAPAGEDKIVWSDEDELWSSTASQFFE
jgi:hypothetical protein